MAKDKWLKIRMSDKHLILIDEECKKLDLNRSTFIRKVLTDYFSKKQI